MKAILSLRLPSLANARMHWRELAQMKTSHRFFGKVLAGDALLTSGFAQGFAAKSRSKIVVTLTRVGARRLDDDNLAAAFKHVRDGIAEWCGLDDGSPRWEWRYEQAIERGTYAVVADFKVGRKS